MKKQPQRLFPPFPLQEISVFQENQQIIFSHQKPDTQKLVFTRFISLITVLRFLTRYETLLIRLEAILNIAEVEKASIFVHTAFFIKGTFQSDLHQEHRQHHQIFHRSDLHIQRRPQLTNERTGGIHLPDEQTLSSVKSGTRPLIGCRTQTPSRQ